jgi:trk system potassium uptake protein TrkH
VDRRGRCRRPGPGLCGPFDAPEALYRAEARSRRLGSSIRSTGRRIWGLYGAFSIAAVSALWLSGASPWTALNHGLTGVSTGGFTVHADSLASTDLAQRLVLMVVMLVGATSFSLFHSVLVVRRWSALARCIQLPVFVALVAAGAVLVAWLEPGLGLVDAAFQWTSAVATCGFSVVPPEQMSDAALASMAVGMLIGGMVGSTAGGLKIERLVVLGQAVWRRMLHRPPRVRTDDGWFEGDDARERVRTALKLLMLIMASVSVGIVALVAVDEAQRPLVHHIFEATSAIGCVGLSAGVANADLSTGGKLVLIVLMWVGRLEVVAVLTLVASPFRVHQKDWLPGVEADGRPGSSPQEPEPSLQEPHDP